MTKRQNEQQVMSTWQGLVGVIIMSSILLLVMIFLEYIKAYFGVVS